MNKYEILISETAQQDLREIIKTITKENKGKPGDLNIVNKMDMIISGLAQAPFRQPLVSDERMVTAGIRKLKTEQCTVFFIATEKEKTVSVVRVLQEQRHWEGLV